MTPASKQSYRIVDTLYHIEISPEELAHQLAHVLSGFQTTAEVPPDRSYVIKQASNGTISRTSTSGRERHYPSATYFLPQFELELIKHAIRKMPYLAIHAGAIAWGDKPVLFPGHSGSGKTTLTLGCTLSGAQLITDEIGVLAPKTLRLRAFPRTLCLKNQSLPLFDTLDKTHRLAPHNTVQAIANTQCIRAASLNRIPIDTEMKLEAIVFPRYEKDAPTKCQKIAETAALSELLKSVMNRNRFPDQSFNAATQCATGLPCYTLQMGNLPEAISCVHALCEQL